MTIESLQGVYDIFSKIFGREVVIAIGGRYSLIKHGILDADQEIGDVDVNVFYKYPRASEIIKNIRRNLLDAWNMDVKIHPRLELFLIENDLEYHDYREPKLVYKKIEGVEFAEKLTSIVIQKAAVKKEPLLSAKERAEQRLNEAIRSTLWNINSSGESYIVNGSPSAYSSGSAWDVSYGRSAYADINSSSSSKSKPGQISLDNIDQGEMIEVIPYFKTFLERNNDKIKIDIFGSQSENIRKAIHVIDDEYLFNPYYILQAKHKYCTESITPQASFDKHIMDLTRSYKTIKLEGINNPKEIQDLLLFRNTINKTIRENNAKEEE